MTVGKNACAPAHARSFGLVPSIALGRSVYIGLGINPSFKSLDLKETAEAYGWILNFTRQYLNEMDVPNSVIEAMMATDFEELKWIDADREGLTRSPSFAELVDANCGILSEKDKELLSRRFSSPKTPEELIVAHRLRLCPTELLSRQRDKLLPP